MNLQPRGYPWPVFAVTSTVETYDGIFFRVLSHTEKIACFAVLIDFESRTRAGFDPFRSPTRGDKIFVEVPSSPVFIQKNSNMNSFNLKMTLFLRYEY